MHYHSPCFRLTESLSVFHKSNISLLNKRRGTRQKSCADMNVTLMWPRLHHLFHCCWPSTASVQMWTNLPSVTLEGSPSYLKSSTCRQIPEAEAELRDWEAFTSVSNSPELQSVWEPVWWSRAAVSSLLWPSVWGVYLAVGWWTLAPLLLPDSGSRPQSWHTVW